jgi:hypothetical protein
MSLQLAFLILTDFTFMTPDSKHTISYYKGLEASLTFMSKAHTGAGANNEKV